MRRAIATAAMVAVIASVFALPASAVIRNDSKSLGDQITSDTRYDWRGRDYDIIGNAVDVLGLDTTLDSGEYTVFLPNDRAMKRLVYDLTGEWVWRESQVIDKLLTAVAPLGDPATVVTNVILYHVVPGTVDSAAALSLDGESVGTALEGATFEIDVRSERRAIVRLEDVADGVRDPYLIRWDLDNFASNGVWHGISRVLLPVDV